jgi:hypothetical protein
MLRAVCAVRCEVRSNPRGIFAQIPCHISRCVDREGNAVLQNENVLRTIVVGAHQRPRPLAEVDGR